MRGASYAMRLTGDKLPRFAFGWRHWGVTTAVFAALSATMARLVPGLVNTQTAPPRDTPDLMYFSFVTLATLCSKSWRGQFTSRSYGAA